MISTLGRFFLFGITVCLAVQSLWAQQSTSSYVTLTTSKAVKSAVKLVIEGAGELKLTGLKLIKEENQFG